MNPEPLHPSTAAHLTGLPWLEFLGSIDNVDVYYDGNPNEQVSLRYCAGDHVRHSWYSDLVVATTTARSNSGLLERALPLISAHLQLVRNIHVA